MKSLKIFFLFISCFAYPQHYIIGDSQSFYIAKQSLKTKVLKPLSKVGIGVAELNNFFATFKIDENAKNVFVSIGVNDGYEDRGIKKLTSNLKEKFPNANLFIIRGSYGWGNVQGGNFSFKKFEEYYKKFEQEKIFVFNSNIGNGDPHRDKYEYWKIAVNIDCIVYKTEGYDCVY